MMNAKKTTRPASVVPTAPFLFPLRAKKAPTAHSRTAMIAKMINDDQDILEVEMLKFLFGMSKSRKGKSRNVEKENFEISK
jgi:hypothetical protein